MATFFAEYSIHDDATDEEVAACERANDEDCLKSSVEEIVQVCILHGFEARVFDAVNVSDEAAPGRRIGFVDCEGTWHPEAGQLTAIDGRKVVLVAEDGSIEATCTLAEFFAANECMDEDERDACRNGLRDFGAYAMGGGACPLVRVEFLR